jgi:hypothetical protein
MARPVRYRNYQRNEFRTNLAAKGKEAVNNGLLL